MILSANPAVNVFRVEISGWDNNKAFFVENSELEWSEESGKQVTLSRTLSDGAVVFLRLLQPMSTDRSHPVAYEAELVSSTERGQQQFRLRPISSRPSRRMQLLSK
jgi:hypothetical protein